ncbi:MULTISPECIES: alpha/beta fold hydrolase [unclassified Novosphingobium]|uniref:alpha/beta fold hydrolase n=1 Tax=unclassified Novosphingobium TaxID=2644732 RepID=UPI001359A99F|nr:MULTISPECIES: alpha/beta hydrolase [unclassified Novosphingobium]
MNAQIDRGFVRIAEGQVHYRSLPALPGAQGARPLVMLHLSPASSRSLEPLMAALRGAGHEGAILAPDTLGNGDSARPAHADADIAYFAGSTVRMADALGLGAFDLYGSHTGARIACEIAVSRPDRVGALVMSGITEYDDATQALYTESYVPRVEPDEYGRQMVWGFHFVRDQHLFAPYFRREAAFRLAKDVPPPEVLHEGALDILKALDTYHIPYLAAFGYRTYARAALVRAPALLMQPEWGPPKLNAAAADIAAAMRDGRVAAPTGGLEGYAASVAAFLAACAAALPTGEQIPC